MSPEAQSPDTQSREFELELSQNDIYSSQPELRYLYLEGYRAGVEYALVQNGLVTGSISFNRSTESYRAYANGFESGVVDVTDLSLELYRKHEQEKDDIIRMMQESVNNRND